jgi:hypothetical protein
MGCCQSHSHLTLHQWTHVQSHSKSTLRGC